MHWVSALRRPVFEGVGSHVAPIGVSPCTRHSDLAALKDCSAERLFMSF